MDRGQLADFLRRRRAAVRPGDVGMPAGPRRRTEGLRREEVAQLAAISVDYYTRLEQRRAPRPSRQVLAALARALRLTGDERDHLFRLAGEPAPEPTGAGGHVQPALLHVLDRLDDTPAMVINHRGDMLAWNPMHAAVFGDPSRYSERERNVAWLFFTAPDARCRFLEEDRAELASAHVAHLRAVSGLLPADEALARLVRELRAASEEFAQRWTEHVVAVRRAASKRVLHPTVGLLELDCDILVDESRDHRLVLHTAPPGTETHDRLALLRVVGLQELPAGSRAIR